MKKSFRLFSLKLLAGVCALLLLTVGCAPAGDGDNSSEGSEAPALTGDAAAFAGLKFDIDPNLDLEGREMTIAVWGSVPSDSSSKYRRRYTLYDRTEKKYNVKINWIASNMSTFEQDYALAYTARNFYADIMFCPSYNGYNVAKIAGALVPLDDYIDYTNDRYKGIADMLMYVDGKHYSYMPNEMTANSLGYTVTYNTTILQAHGCADPYELYQQGKWDWDTFTEIVRKCTTTSNGVTTCYGVGGSNLLDAMLLSNGVSLIQMNTANNKFECGLYSNAGKNTLQQLKKLLFDIKGVDGWYGNDNSILNFKDSKLAMIVGPQYYGGNFITIGMPIMTVPLPKGPDVDCYVNGLQMAEWWVLPSISKFKTEEVLQVAFDAIRNDPEYEDTYISPEGRREDFILQTYDENVLNTEEEAAFFYDFITSDDVKTLLGITNNDIKKLMKENVWVSLAEGENPRTLLERVKPVIDTALINMLPDAYK
jgi:ABC-type glycerol-3-phosphate transport system substrate-binding protein